MKPWLIRILVFALLWGCLWIRNDVKEAIFSLQMIVCAAAFTIYFFLPIMKRPIWFYLILQGLFCTFIWLDVPFMWIWIFLLFLTIEAVFLLSVIELRVLLVYSFGLLLLCSTILNEWPIPLFLAALFFFIIEVWLNRSFIERQEQGEVYQQLLGEYRQVKRMNLENEQVARLEERTRIARDIHDSVGHKLTALLMQLEMFSIQKKSEEYRELKALAIESLEETRLAVKTLKNEEVSGITSVIQLIRKLEAENQLLIRFTTKQGVLLTALSNEQSIVLYRSVQEALTNAMKHGSTKEVSLTFGRSAVREIKWVVSNHIHGPVSFEAGFGLTAMRERVEEQGGQLRIYQTETEFIIEGSMPVS
ncbi:sensor histidine kinase [Bacillus sp. SD088]|uniref:sensor histidine kinase n=1 Tax=Bacillus sp. SD088 TaxID=2782012 RepID=UPI001A9731D2|nr:sensor histidine kinase [Bacillus sp. SD088]MBO0995583.1 sensor histidine kinase [Bacillus sp. SD088]